MKSSCIPHGLALAALLALASTGARATSSELHALSEEEMSSVYGRGPSDNALSALGLLAQSGSSASAADVLAALDSVDGDAAQSLDRQLTQQRLQNVANSVSTTVKLAQSLTALSTAFAALDSLVSLPILSLPLFGLPSPATLAAITKKH